MRQKELSVPVGGFVSCVAHAAFTQLTSGPCEFPVTSFNLSVTYEEKNCIAGVQGRRLPH